MPAGPRVGQRGALGKQDQQRRGAVEASDQRVLQRVTAPGRGGRDLVQRGGAGVLRRIVVRLQLRIRQARAGGRAALAQQRDVLGRDPAQQGQRAGAARR
ncbi:hypothetical protein DPM13_00455 [Paracoccus mutanolyticus]|uniref:Uncharacterized protein n=1 Tax=Paracoccus mutanolyticus TaxID=1499308 RepID=A0ABN5M3Q8_9RHOB|nr:hypothetical protein [Paracoccus mutanolyticus]AWX92281.1 hypothetical protein DPM13_00455 [Paracoccus mutanolyticus]